MKKITQLSLTAPTMPTEKKIRVAAYCRVSTDTDAQLESLAAQKSHYESMINARPDWEFAGLYYDEGISGTKKDKRPELLRMLSDCATGKIDMILTKSISRFARNTAECLEMVRSLSDLKIPIFFEKENLNTGDMESEFILTIMSSLAQAESTSISENTKWTIRQHFRNGTYKFCSPPYGYHWDGKQVLIVPEEAETVRWIFRQVLSGNGTQTIANELNRKGIPAKRGNKWGSTTVLQMIKNTTYTGDAVFQKTYTDAQFNRHVNYTEKEQYEHKKHHEAIISREDFDIANSMIRQHCLENGIKSKDDTYLHRYCFTGRIFCGECGSSFKRRIHTCGSDSYIAWCCITHLTDRERCHMKYIRDDDLKAAFTRMINKLVFGHRIVLGPYLEALKGGMEADTLLKIKQLQKEQVAIAEKQDVLAKLMAEGFVDLPVYTNQNNQLLSEADRLRAEINTLSKSTEGASQYAIETAELLRFTEKADMLDAFDENLFSRFVSRIQVISRSQVAFELKCGLSLRERL